MKIDRINTYPAKLAFEHRKVFTSETGRLCVVVKLKNNELIMVDLLACDTWPSDKTPPNFDNFKELPPGTQVILTV